MISFERFWILLGILVVFGEVGNAGAVVFQVPGDFGTIQGAIDVAESGDEIVVAAGTYPEVINFNGKAIYLHSASGDPVDTIIDGTGLNDSVVQCISGEGAGTVLEGFTITGGTGHTAGKFNTRRGGGIYNDNSSPTIINCFFIGNTAGSGGGMKNSNNSNPSVTKCLFNGNGAYGGGGMSNSNDSNPTLKECTFSENSARNGGGMSNYACNPTVINCIFTENINQFVGSRGGGMLNVTSSPTVANCIFNGNMAFVGGGMFSEGNGSPRVTNCTFTGNSAGGGGGMINLQGNPIVTNCIFWSNSPDEISFLSSPFTVSFSVIQGGLPFTTIDGGGNINADPHFIDALGPDNIPGTADDDLRYLSGSPCIDAGINGGVMGDVVDINADGCTLERIPVDFDGNPRFMDDPLTVNSGCGVSTLGVAAIVDMGAYEFAGTPAPKILIGDTNGNGLINIDDLVDVLNAFGFGSGCSDADVNGDGAVGMTDLLAVLDGFGGCG